MAELHGQNFTGFYHLNYDGASATGADCMVATLRDPVERFVSEWTMARSFEGRLMAEEQWDFHADDLAELERANASTAGDTSKPRDFHTEDVAEFERADAGTVSGAARLLEYLDSPNNPTRNRQALYLLGFRRVRCRTPGLPEGTGTCSSAEPYGYPAHAYAWERDHDDLLARAKRRLMELRGFWVTDCYAESLKLIAESLSWDPEVTAGLGRNVHAREQKTPAALSSLARGQGMTIARGAARDVRAREQKAPAALHSLARGQGTTIAGDVARDVHAREQKAPAALRSLPRGQGTTTAGDGGTRAARWRQALPAEIERRIRKANRVDDELVRFAKQQLYAKHGLLCD